jgi:hypothetical protein
VIARADPSSERPRSVPTFAQPTRWLGWLALLATLAVRGPAQALPGSAPGLAGIIDASRLVAALLSQLLVVTGATTIVGLLGGTLWQERLSYAYRLLALPATAIVLTLVTLSIRAPLDETESLMMGSASALLTMVAGLSVMRSPDERAPGLVLAAVGLSALGQLLAYGLPHGRGVTPLGFATATLAYGIDLIVLALATTWVASRGGRHRWIGLAGGLVAAAIAVGADRGARLNASLWEVLAARSLTSLARWPAPQVSDIAQFWTDSYAIVMAAVILLIHSPRPAVATALSLALLARGQPGTPACALLLVLAALMTTAARAGPSSIQTPASSPA